MNNNNKNNNEQNYIDIPSFMNQKPPTEDYSFMKDLNSSLSDQVNSFYEEDRTPPRRPTRPNRKRKKKKKFLKVASIVLLVLVAIGSLLVFTKPGNRLIIQLAGKYIYSNFQFQATADEEDTNKLTKPIINILLIGVEEIGGAKNTDSMIIATMNTTDHTLKLTSIMRDIYVQIPGYSDNKLNSAYPKGDIDLLYETIELNFGVDLDGYCLVNFDVFQTIIDKIGGVEITLTKKEAEYLNSTNYISKKSNRHVVEGKQLMNGNQALGYCRVRKVSTGTENNDFGRTQRQRIVLQAIYDKVKSKNIVSLALLMNSMLAEAKIKTDITQAEFNTYLEVAAGLKVKSLETHRIPSDGSFENASVPIGSRNVSVLKIKDWEATRKEIAELINGKTATAEANEEVNE
jgi:LCP family protein required for cell wall assembly